MRHRDIGDENCIRLLEPYSSGVVEGNGPTSEVGMRWATIRMQGGEERTGVVADEVVHAAPSGVRLLDVLNDEGVALDEAGASLVHDPDLVVARADVTLRAPIPRPPTVRDFYAFETHAKTARRSRGLELDPAWYEFPAFYFSNPMAICGPYDPVPIAPGSTRWDYELEVGAVVGLPGRDLHPDTAEQHIAGFCVLGDYSARDIQLDEMRIGLGPTKAKDTATVLGPYLVTADEVLGRRRGHGFDLAMRGYVNDELWSDGNLADLYWSFGEMMAFASRGTTLMPGDVIGCGTVGSGCIQELSGTHGSDRYAWLAPGDVVRLEVELLGAIENEIVATPDPIPLRPPTHESRSGR